MRILGIVFAGSSTEHASEMHDLMMRLTGVPPVPIAGASAHMFELGDGSVFAVSEPGGMGADARSIGFLVEAVDQARIELLELGLEVDEIAENSRFRYLHFIAPDGNTYELVEDLSGRTSTGSAPMPL